MLNLFIDNFGYSKLKTPFQKTISFLFILWFFLFLPCLSFGQFDTIDKNAQSVPDSLYTYEQIAHHLTKNLETDLEKVRAIFVWIAHNIEYDIKSYDNKTIAYEFKLEMLDDLLRSKKGVCGQYSYLFQVMCGVVGLESYFISGIDYSLSEEGHAWNAVEIDGEYYLFDVTWSAGRIANFQYFHEFNDAYFMLTPQRFIKSHFPHDPIFQFLENPITLDDFLYRDFSKLDEKSDYNFRDTLKTHFEKTELNQFISTYQRMEKNKDLNPAYDKNLEWMWGSLNIMLANHANQSCNTAIDVYNKFMNSKRKFFKRPKMSKERVKEMIDLADFAIRTATNHLKKVDYVSYENKKWFDDLKIRVDEMESLIEREKKFVKKYSKTPKIFRPFVVFFMI